MAGKSAPTALTNLASLKEPQRVAIERHVREFLARGGSITILPSCGDTDGRKVQEAELAPSLDEGDYDGIHEGSSDSYPDEEVDDETC